MKKINTSVLLNFINEATSNIITEIDTNDYLKKEHLGSVNFSADLLSIINTMDEQKIFKLIEEAVDYINENVFVLKNYWYRAPADRDCYLLVLKFGDKFYSIYKAYDGQEVDYNISKDPLPFCEGYILEEKENEVNTIKALDGENYKNEGYDFYFIDNLFLDN